MKDNFQDIEKLFRESLEGFETEVDANLWSNIADKIGHQAPVQDPSSVAQSASGSGSAGLGMGVAKIAAIVVTSGVLSVAAYVAFTDEESDNSVADRVEEVTAIRHQDQLNQNDEARSEANDTYRFESDNGDRNSQTKSLKNEVPEKNILVEQAGEQVTPSEPVEKVENQQITRAAQEQVTAQEKPVEHSPAAAAKTTQAQAIPTKSPESLIKEMDIFEASIYASVKNGKMPLEVLFENRGSYSNDVVWRFRDGGTSNQLSPVHTFEQKGEYWVVLEIRSEDGRLSIDSVKITSEGNAYINVPNVFTPNGDGLNDAFKIETENVRSLKCQIFDRNQRLVFVINNIYGHWDGRDQAENMMPEGSYFYVIEAVDESGNQLATMKGVVTLFR